MFQNIKSFFNKTPLPTVELIPVVRYINGCFEMRTGEYLNIYKIVCKDLLNCSDDEISTEILTLEKFFKTVSSDIKIVGMNLPTNTQLQQEYFRYKIDKTKNPIYQKYLRQKLEALENIEQSSTERQYYLFTFAKSLELDNDLNGKVRATLGTRNLVEPLNQRQKEIVLYKYNNPGSLIPDKRLLEVDIEEMKILYPPIEGKSKKAPPTLDEIIEEKGYNPFLLERIQPQGGLLFDQHESYIKTGDGYTACLTVYGCPKRSRWFWLCAIANINNAIVTIDIRTEDPEKVKQNLNRSISEYRTRVDSEKKASDGIEAQHKLEMAVAMMEEIATMDEVTKSIIPRIFLTGATIEETDGLVDDVRNYLKSNSYRSMCCVNEAKNDYISFYLSCSKQKEIGKEYFRIGMPFSSHVLAGGDPFIFSSLNDEFGSYFGDTNIEDEKSGNDGKVLFDPFHLDGQRYSYNAIITGLMGSGKSSMIKWLLLDRSIRGDYVRGFDPTGEYSAVTDELGGKTIALDGSCGIINAFEIYKVAETEKQCWQQHISKMSIQYRFLKESATVEEVNAFEEYVRQLYVKFGILPSDDDFTNAQITGRHPDEYPTFSDFLVFLRELLQEKLKAEVTRQEEVVLTDEVLQIRSIESVINNVVSNYGYILDGHTNVDNMMNTQIVIFNIKNLVKIKPEICNFQIYNALSICWDNCLRIGQAMKNAYDERKIPTEDIIHCLILIDEAHRIVNTQRPFAVDQLNNFSMEGRKYFLALYLASPDIRKFFPENSSQEGVDKIKILFSNAIYKFNFKQDNSMLKVFREIFEGQFNEEELQKIPRFTKKGECILSIAGYKNIHFRIRLTEDEIALFEGGA